MKHRGVEGGTPQHGRSKCFSCRHAQVVRGEAVSDETVYCWANYTDHAIQIRSKIVECSKYDSLTDAPLRAMEDIAWVLRTKAAGREIGFMSPMERKKKGLDVEDV